MDDHLRFNLDTFVGARTLNLAKQTRMYTLSHAIDALLYSMQGPAEVCTTKSTTRFPNGLLIPEARAYIGDGGTNFPGRDGKYFDVPRMLREVQMELERLALIEVTR